MQIRQGGFSKNAYLFRLCRLRKTGAAKIKKRGELVRTEGFDCSAGYSSLFGKRVISNILTNFMHQCTLKGLFTRMISRNKPWLLVGMKGVRVTVF